MKLRYVDSPEVRFRANDKIFVDMEFCYTGETFKNMELRRMFPVSGKDNYIAVIDSDGEEQAMIRNVNNLDAESKKVVNECLEEYYMIPRITRFIEMTDKYRIWMWTAETDKGTVKFEIRNPNASIKALSNNRVLIKDANDNRYEIPDYTKLDKRSRKMIIPNL
ncbi:MAG: DUF1854 domain-containing protein [Clostridiales bacterium]|nr:DUF1854 domain-containing protein [Clostridiales bacterium]